MTDSIIERDRRASAGWLVPKALLLTSFAAAMFLAGRLWSRREVWEAQRAAGLAEQERLAFQAELTECRNALRLRERREMSGGPDDAGPRRDLHSGSQVVRSDYVTNRRDTIGNEP
jgi:hypothetical protein